MQFRFYRYRFHFLAQGSLYFPPGKTGNILRGALGLTFRSVACMPECHDSRTCEMRATCPYARTFEPSGTGDGPSGLADPPRPFVFRASHLDGLTIASGDTFHFDVNLFQIDDPPVLHFTRALERLALDGLGPGRPRAALTSVEQLDFDGVPVCGDPQPSLIALDATQEIVSRARIRFLTPTELKSGQQIATRPDFSILMARIRDRISTLTALYDKGPLPLDFTAFGGRAARVTMSLRNIELVEVNRLSTRTGQRHSIGGFVGTAEYEGDLAEFVPFLRAAQYTGVGRQTTWGKGELSVTIRE